QPASTTDARVRWILPPRSRLREEAGPQPHRCGHALDPELQEDGIVGRGESPPCAEVELDQARTRFGVHSGELDPKPLQSADQLVEEAVIAPDLAEAVADAARRGLLLGIPDPDLVLDRGQHLVAELLDTGEDPPENFSCCEVARRSIGPAGCRQTDPPPRSPRQLPEGLDVRV